MKRRAMLFLALHAVGPIPLLAQSGFFPELSQPLFEYCEKVEESGLIHEQLGYLFEQCRQAHGDDELLAQEQESPEEYLRSLRKLDKMHNKSLWELHLLLRSAIEEENVELFEKIASLEVRRIFEMNGLLPHVIAFTQRHGLELPYFINPNIKSTPFQYDWKPKTDVNSSDNETNVTAEVIVTDNRSVRGMGVE